METRRIVRKNCHNKVKQATNGLRPELYHSHKNGFNSIVYICLTQLFYDQESQNL